MSLKSSSDHSLKYFLVAATSATKSSIFNVNMFMILKYRKKIQIIVKTVPCQKTIIQLNKKKDDKATSLDIKATLNEKKFTGKIYLLNL